MSGLWIAIHLLLLSAEDMKEGRLSVILIGELGLTGYVRAVYTGGATEWLPGILLLGLGYMSKERIGYGDGLLMLALGMWLPLRELFLILELGALFCILFAVAARRKELPFVPFLTAAYLLGGLNTR